MENFFIAYKPMFTVTHVLCVVGTMGAALMSDLLFNFYTKDKYLSKNELHTLGLLSKIVFWGLPLVILSGVAIFFSNTEKYIHSVKFLAKMTLMIILLLNGLILDKIIWPHLLQKKFFTSIKEQYIRKISFICGSISVISWLFICSLGVLDKVSLAYSHILGIYGLILIPTFAIALYIENKEFEK